MELIQQYLDEVTRVGGLYVFYFDASKHDFDEITQELERLQERLPDETFVILDKELDLTYQRDVSFYLMLMGVRAGRQAKWSRRLSEDSYITLHDVNQDGVAELCVVQKDEAGNEEAFLFCPTAEDLDADYRIMLLNTKRHTGNMGN